MNISVQDVLSVGYMRAVNVDKKSNMKFKGVSTDTRTIAPGDLFVALRGENFDGNKFVATAFQKGAVCAVVDAQADTATFSSKPFFVVQDTAITLGQLAHVYRKKFSIPVLAVAGSNGKTTTKEMISAVLAAKYNVLSTSGNLNNHIGVPQTLFGLKKKHDVAVVEVGTNHFGELKYLTGILEPTHAIITNIGHEHLEFFKDLDGVAKAEGELFNGLKSTATAFVNSDDKYIPNLAKKVKKKVTYGYSGKKLAIKGTLVAVDAKGCVKFTVKADRKREFTVKLSTPGTQGMINALAASAVGLSFGVSAAKIQHALKKFKPVGKRMEVVSSGGVTILNDTYNANPDSVIAALETVRVMRSTGKKIIILADMLELGESSAREHERIGEHVQAMGFKYLLTFGQMAARINTRVTCQVNFNYDQKNVLSEYAAELILPGDIVLVKGSRGMKMEDVVTFLRERLERHAA